MGTINFAVLQAGIAVVSTPGLKRAMHRFKMGPVGLNKKTSGLKLDSISSKEAAVAERKPISRYR